MPRRRWIKLWTQETLYGTTSQELELDEQAIWFKLLALAGDSIEPGKIEIAPGIPMTDEQISGILKVPLEIWHRAKNRLQHPDVDKIIINEGIIHIKNWEKYQSDWERIKKYPSQQPTKKPTNNLTVGKTTQKPTGIPDQNRPEQKNNITTTASENLAKISKLYEDNIGRLTPAIAESLKDIDEKYPPDWFEEALKESVKSEHRNLKYISAILERWKVEGFKAPKKRDGGRGVQPGKGVRPKPQQGRVHPVKRIDGETGKER